MHIHASPATNLACYPPGATPAWTRYTSDGSGRTLTVTAPDGVSVTAYQYLGNQTKVTDPAGGWKSYAYDANGNLTRVTEPGQSDYVHETRDFLVRNSSGSGLYGRHD